MYKHKHSILLFVLGVMFVITSCKDSFFNVVPTDQLTDPTYWKTPEDFELAVNAVYPYLPDQHDMMELDALSDNAFYNLTFDAYYNIANGSATSRNFTQPWDNHYEGIRRANTILNRIQDIQFQDQALKQRLIAETKVLRSYLYFELAFRYGDVPYVTEEITIEEGHTVSQTPHEQIIDSVLINLESAAQNLPASYEGNNVGRITKGAAMGLRARFALYEERYEVARDAAQQVMDMNQYSLLDNYADVFTYEHENSSEVILANEYSIPDRENNLLGVFGPPSQQGATRVSPLRSLVNAYEMQTTGLPITNPNSGYDPENPYQNRDPRLDATLIRPGTEFNGTTINALDPNSTDYVGSSWYHTQTGLYLNKYVTAADSDHPSRSGLDLIVLRYPEILLTYAEAKIELGEIDQSVYNAINTVRNRANMPDIATGLSQDSLRQIVRHERRVEFAFEGHRFYDIRRWRIAHEIIPGNVYGLDQNHTAIHLNASHEEKIFVEERAFSERYYLWAIPPSERELNPNLKQNPGW